MQTLLLLVAALAAGYAGGYLALAHARQLDKVELRGVVDELLSELRFTAEESCDRISRERSQLEQLARTLNEKAAMSVHTTYPNDSAPDGASTIQAASPLTGRSPLWSQVVSLADQGKDYAQIAKELHLGQGEVELILNLQRQEQSSSAHLLP